MLQVLPVIFLLTVVIEVLVPKEMITKGFGEKSGIKGNGFICENKRFAKTRNRK